MHKFSDWILSLHNKEQQSCADLFAEIVDTYCLYTREEDQNIDILKKAYAFAEKVHRDQKRDSGALYFTHPLIVASLLQHYEVDEKILAATLLHDAIEDSQEEGTDHEVKQIFGEDVYYLVDGVSKVSSHAKSNSHRETLQKIFSHSAHDARILLIKIADRIHNIATLGFKVGEEKRQKKIEETLGIFVLAAEKLQLDYFKNTLLNACSYYLMPEKFRKVEQEVSEKTPEARSIFHRIEKEILEGAKEKEATVRIEYRPYDISNLLKRGDADIYDLKPADIFYIDIITHSKEQCYQALALLSARYHHKTALLSDFIANPPENFYRALKTSMVVHNAFLVRFHILSEKMEKDNAKGILNRIQKEKYTLPFFSTEGERGNADQFVDMLQHDMLSKKKAVHNSQRGQKFIPVDSNALDAVVHLFPKNFIYITHIYREGKALLFSDSIADNDILECRFSDTVQANVSWMKYLHSRFGRIHLQNILKEEQDFTKSRMGKDILQSAFDVFKEGEVSSILHNFPEIYESFFAQTRDELYIFIAEGMVSSKDVLLKYEEIKSRKQSFWGRIKTGISTFFTEKIEKKMKIVIASKALSSAELIALIAQKSLGNGVCIEKLDRLSTSRAAHTRVSVNFYAERRSDLFTLFSLLKSHTKIFSLSFIPSFRFYTKMMLFFTLPFIVNLLVFVFFLPQTLDISFTTLIPVVLIFLINAWGYSKTSHYLHVLRKNTSFIFSLFFVNIAFLAVYFSLFFHNILSATSQNIFLMAALFCISFIPSLLLYVNSREKIEVIPSEISQSDWDMKKKEKIKGYIIRFFAVIIWGIQPLYIKYTPMNTLDMEYRILFIAIGGMLASFLSITLFLLLNKARYWKPRLTINSLFFAIVASEILFIFFMNKSLLFTSSTNLIIFNNFAPLLALFIAIVLWRKQILYLKDRKNVLKIIGIFILGGLGSTLIIYNDVLHSAVGSVKGDILALLLMVSDVILVVAQIRYAKYLKDGQSAFLNLYMYGAILLFIIPWIYLHVTVFSELSSSQIWFALGAGVLSGVGQILNNEAFRRMDGFIAFLMFNISILITFVIEAFILEKIFVTYLLLIGGILVIISSALAEFINTKCEEEQVKI